MAGKALPTEAWIGTDVYGDQEIVLIGFVYPDLPGDPGHSICVLVDHTEGGVAKDAYPAAPLAQTLARWREAEGDGISLRPASLAEVAARLADALLATDFADRQARTDGRTLAEMRALLSSRLTTLPPAANTGLEELDADGRDWLVAEFLGAPEAADLSPSRRRSRSVTASSPTAATTATATRCGGAPPWPGSASSTTSPSRSASTPPTSPWCPTSSPPG